MGLHTTGEVAKHLDITVRAVRYYDQIGLVSPAAKDPSGRRLYSEEEVRELEKVLLLKSLAMGLDDIEKILKETTIAEILTLNEAKLRASIADLEQSLGQNEALKNSLRLEGTIRWDALLPLVRDNKQRTDQNRWNHHFNEEEQMLLKQDLPKMEEAETKKWIRLVERTRICIERGIGPDSIDGRLIAEDCLALSAGMLGDDPVLIDKFWQARKSEETSAELGLYPVSLDILTFLEEAFQHLPEQALPHPEHTRVPGGDD
ncbi:MerR family transcriptional regulator [Halobacillus sp. ACCC02827]|uniref:MerR family transcriptional regulator n=1 Tax=Bacillaceae TaxID=186817 RepID=UPI0002A4E79C|nr:MULTISPECIES: MerR family transcriptional regulator [Bacillaceae]ELK45648.1 MerR family transcriptional regulator [Halobacillus sp. BAB-2008]QHT46175.1 MerR family transcriptional regulator [Bacillus sp. SB49]WJE16991.1 MerR family transcriptional regulator [Halobacillus sp. ACCC02827]